MNCELIKHCENVYYSGNELFTKQVIDLLNKECPEMNVQILDFDQVTFNTYVCYNGTKINNDFNDGPALVTCVKNGIYIMFNIMYLQNGVVNRPYKLGPAQFALCIYLDGDYWIKKSYVKNNKLHRPVEDGPAQIHDDNIYFSKYWENGYEIENNSLENHKFKKQMIQKIEKNWKISKWNGIYREFLTQVLTVPENHESLVGKLFPKGGYDYKKFKESVIKFA
jgi:hypothetical protein